MAILTILDLALIYYNLRLAFANLVPIIVSIKLQLATPSQTPIILRWFVFFLLVVDLRLSSEPNRANKLQFINNIKRKFEW